MHAVSVYGQECPHTLRLQNRSNACRTATPVISGQYCTRQGQRFHEIQHILPDRRLLAHPGCRIIEKAGWTKAAQIRHKHATARFRKQDGNRIPTPHVVGKTMQ
jgi:hypothetical protein